ncbi:MAG: hypothetical protein ACQEQO_11765 [Thermodesulfobacteriota bacterium]
MEIILACLKWVPSQERKPGRAHLKRKICSKMNPPMDSHLISEHHGGKILARYTELISKIERHSIDVIQNFAELIFTL